MTDPLHAAHTHCQSLLDALGHLRRRGLGQLTEWGGHLAAVLPLGGRLLAAGNGGSAAQAQHLTAELVGRYRTERPAYSAIALHAETSTLTAIGNDYGFEELYARQVSAHGRPGDVLLLMSTSGRSPNLLAAADTGRLAGLRVWAMTGPRPNPLADRADEALCIEADNTATVQEAHLVALHLLCESFDAAARTDAAARAATGPLPAGAHPAPTGRTTGHLTATTGHPTTGHPATGRTVAGRRAPVTEHPVTEDPVTGGPAPAPAPGTPPPAAPGPEVPAG
ncbi:D-sedoheptulose 7-phosphate isomerase [Streptomyces syringium]|uniref:D-sedoheptulose 7-phosphate isomerase n=1 Tax=Streptomyces syringium TaxID=76729 RepID=A0ABS4YF81_9ACTN|nr:SIS domain-containing protein [Streptomyces syringium]MBP2407082.1 D-sedoheptulose 7-phosphate isomerase [Streptomyces syringium]